MIVYDGVKTDFLTSVENDTIAMEIENIIIKKCIAILLKLKQWDQLTAVEGEDALVETFTGNATRMVVHPSYQAWSYSMLIRDYNQAVQDEEIRLKKLYMRLFAAYFLLVKARGLLSVISAV